MSFLGLGKEIVTTASAPSSKRASMMLESLASLVLSLLGVDLVLDAPRMALKGWTARTQSSAPKKRPCIVNKVHNGTNEYVWICALVNSCRRSWNEETPPWPGHLSGLEPRFRAQALVRALQTLTPTLLTDTIENSSWGALLHAR